MTWTETPTGCWEWQGQRTPRGYGQVWLPGRRRVGAHRWVYEREVGPIPEGMMLLHSCDNPPCVNPAHLRPGTQLDNRGDAVRRRRTAIGARDAAAKMTDEQFASIVPRVAAGHRPTDIAREYGGTVQAVSQYRKRALARHAAGLGR